MQRILLICTTAMTMMFAVSGVKADECDRVIAEDQKLSESEVAAQEAGIRARKALPDGANVRIRRAQCNNWRLMLDNQSKKVARRKLMAIVCGDRAEQRCDADCWTARMAWTKENLDSTCKDADEAEKSEAAQKTAKPATAVQTKDPARDALLADAREHLTSARATDAAWRKKVPSYADWIVSQGHYKAAAEAYGKAGDTVNQQKVLAEKKQKVIDWQNWAKPNTPPQQPGSNKAECDKLKSLIDTGEESPIDLSLMLQVRERYRKDCEKK